MGYSLISLQLKLYGRHLHSLHNIDCHYLMVLRQQHSQGKPDVSRAGHSDFIHAIRDKVRFSSISFLKIILHAFAQNNDLVRIFRSIFFALVDKLRTKS